MKEIYEEFKKELFVGLKEDEYNISAAIHQDTDYTHIHAIIPKQNLLTGQHLQLYMQGIDTKRMDLIADNIALKHNLKTKEEIKPTVTPVKEYAFEKQRAERSQEKFTFTLFSKKEKALAQQQVTELLKTNIDDINSLDDVKDFIHSSTDLKVVNSGFDRTKEQYYITIQDVNDKKTKIKGELFSDDFFQHSKLKQKEQLNLNSKKFSEVEREAYAKKVRANLKREREKRFKKVQNQGRALKLQLRKEQRSTNNTIRKELQHDRDRNTTKKSPRREQRAVNQRRRKPNTSLTESAIQEQEKRSRAIKEARNSRERIYKQYVKTHEDIRARHQEHSRDLRTKHETNVRREQSVKSSFTDKFREFAKRVKQFAEKVLKVFEKEKAPEQKKEVNQGKNIKMEIGISEKEQFEKMVKELEERNPGVRITRDDLRKANQIGKKTQEQSMSR